MSVSDGRGHGTAALDADRLAQRHYSRPSQLEVECEARSPLLSLNLKQRPIFHRQDGV